MKFLDIQGVGVLWNSIKEKFLPLSGGTMTGSLSFKIGYEEGVTIDTSELPPPSVARKGLLASSTQLARSVTTTGGGRVSTSVDFRRSNGIIIVILKVQRRVDIPVVDTATLRTYPLTL